MPPLLPASALVLLAALAQAPAAAPESADAGATGPDAGSATSAASPPASVKTRTVDRLVAVVERQPVMLSELELEARIVMIGRGGVEAATAPLSDDLLADVLDYVVGQKLAFQEADRLQVFQVEDEDVERALQDFIAKFPSERRYRAFLQRQDATEDQVVQLLRRDLRVSRYLESKLKVVARVDERELKRFYTEHPDDFAGQSYAKVRDGIKSAILRDRYRHVAEDQLNLLRAKADVRMVAPFAHRRPLPELKETFTPPDVGIDPEGDSDTPEDNP